MQRSEEEEVKEDKKKEGGLRRLGLGRGILRSGGPGVLPPGIFCEYIVQSVHFGAFQKHMNKLR